MTQFNGNAQNRQILRDRQLISDFQELGDGEKESDY